MDAREGRGVAWPIMPARSALFTLLACLALPLLASGKDSSEYATMLAALKAGNTHIDYARLRLTYPDSPESKKAKDRSDAEKGMYAALKAKDYANALKDAESVLEQKYINIDAHFVAFVANREMGAADKAEFHQAVYRGLIDSIRNSGDGRSTATAWVVISVDEEYSMLRALGFRPGEQALLDEHGHSYDKMTVKNVEDGSVQTFYFNVDIAMAHEF
jgi:hypothetical protein